MNTRRHAVIKGAGLATPLGASLDATWEALLAGQCILDHAHVPVEFQPGQNRAIHLAVRVAKEAAGRSHWTCRHLADDATALLVGTSKGPIENWMSALLHMHSGGYVVGGLDLSGMGQVAAVVAAELGVGYGPRLTLSAACASGLDALIRAAMMIEHGEADRALVVATESSVHPLFLGSFRRLGVLPPEGAGCKPFDENRQGFLMSEAAAAICLEASETPQGVCIDRHAFAGDATHLTAGDPDGATLRSMLRHVAGHEPVDLFHAHGTGTDANDPIELSAIESITPGGGVTPILYSHKGALGHSLGSAGLVAIALNWLMHRTGQVPGNVRTTSPLPASRVILSSTPLQRNIRRSVAIASGFGGAMAALGLANRPAVE